MTRQPRAMPMVSMAMRPAASHLIGAVRKGRKKSWRVALGTREGCDNESAVDGAAGADAGFDCFASCGEGVDVDGSLLCAQKPDGGRHVGAEHGEDPGGEEEGQDVVRDVGGGKSEDVGIGDASEVRVEALS